MSLLQVKNREDAFTLAKQLAEKEGKNELHESLVLQHSDPRGEWGKNNLKDLITLFHMSGQSHEQIYNILYTMGVEKEKAYDAIQAYLPQKNTSEMTVKENLDFTDEMRNLVDSMNEFKTEDRSTYNADNVIKTCEAYMNLSKDNCSASDLAGMARRTVSNLNQYDFISAVKECINNIERKMYENIMSIEVDSVHNELSNSNSKDMYNSVVERLDSLKEMNEGEIREKLETELSPFQSWVPQVKVLLERASMIDDVKTVKKEKSLSEKFDLKGKIKAIIESVSKTETEKSKFTVKSIKEICERYLKTLYSNQNSLSEANIAGNLHNELQNFSWMGEVKEGLDNIKDFLMENYMSFEVDLIHKSLQKTNERNFYGPAIEKLEEIKDLNESEIREQIKYAMESLTWVPQVRYLIETVDRLEGNLSADEHAIIERKYSPILQESDSTYFYLSGAVYSIKENALTQVDPKTMGALFLTLISVSENFKFGPGSMKYYKGDSTIEFNLTEDGPKFNFNGVHVEVNESADIRNFLLSNGSFRINETSELDMIVKAFENVDNFVELDFVHSVRSRVYEQVTTNVIKLEDKLYINRVNPSMNENEMVLAESATSAIELVKEYIDYDISPLIVEKLEGEQKTYAAIAAKRNALHDKIQFLKEQRSRLSQQDLTNETIKEADKLIISEIEKWQEKLNKLSKEEA